ncbi:MAG: hypothetical protein WC668_01655 [Patescibacteria group bacterium]|jgi:hypothetical protein
MARRKASVAALLAMLKDLSPEELLALTDNPGEVKKLGGELVIKEIVNTFAIPLSDSEMLERFPQFADRLIPWRKLAALMGYTGPVAWLIKQGFTLKKHAPLVGPCYDNLGYLQGWNFGDNPTDDCLVFWVPRLAKNSTGKTIKAMEKHRAELKKRYKLPGNHATYFGSIQLQFALTLAHFKRTGERVPLNLRYAASDTLYNGSRLIAGSFEDSGFYCDHWAEFGFGGIGFVLLGVEKLNQQNSTPQPGDEKCLNEKLGNERN